jgi:hypothetical protein
MDYSTLIHLKIGLFYANDENKKSEMRFFLGEKSAVYWLILIKNNINEIGYIIRIIKNSFRYFEFYLIDQEKLYVLSD